MKKIGETIRSARRAKELTQEQMAEYLHLSVSAVSQWESGRTMPDITALPAICNLLGISADTLLGIDLARREEKIKAVRDEASRHYGRGYYDEARTMLEACLREYPDSYALMSDLMFISYWQWQERGEERLDEAIRLGEAILDGCTVDHTRHSAIQILCYCYTARKEYDRAEELARKMPYLCLAQECLLPHIKQGTAGYRAAQEEVYSLLQNLEVRINGMNFKLDDGSRAYTADECIKLNDKAIALISLLFEEGDFGFYHCHLCGIQLEQSGLFAKQNKAEETLVRLSAAADHALAFLDWTKNVGPHTSLIFRGYGDNRSFSTGDTDNDAARVLREMTHARYDFVRESAAFGEIRERLLPYAEKWTV